MADPDRTLEVLAELRKLGVATSLDDFGAGHVSLGHLKHLRVDELKIDRSFVMSLAHDRRDAAIVHTTVDLGRRLGCGSSPRASRRRRRGTSWPDCSATRRRASTLDAR